jgi:hypothetical protein
VSEFKIFNPKMEAHFLDFVSKTTALCDLFYVFISFYEYGAHHRLHTALNKNGGMFMYY